MGNKNDSETLANQINCLSFFENNVSQLYKEIAGKVWLPLVEALLLEISLDSQKHSTLLKGIAESLPQPDYESKDYAKTIGETWCTIEKFRQEIAEAASIDENEIMELSNQLANLESIMADEYQVFVQIETLQLISVELQRIYRVDIGTIRRLFAEIINDEERHKKNLSTIKSLLDWRQNKTEDHPPEVRFQNPDAWSITGPSL